MGNPIFTIGGGLVGGAATVAVAERAGLSPVMAGVVATGASLAGAAAIKQPWAKQALIAAAGGAAGLVGVQLAAKYLGPKAPDKKQKRQGEGESVTRQELQEALAKAAAENRQTSCDLLAAVKEEIKLQLGEAQKLLQLPAPKDEPRPEAKGEASKQRSKVDARTVARARVAPSGRNEDERNAYGDEYRDADDYRDAYGDYRDGDEYRDAYGEYRDGDGYRDAYHECRDAYGDEERNADEYRDAYGDEERNADDYRDAYGEYRDADEYRDAYGDDERNADEYRDAYGDDPRDADEPRDAYGDDERNADELRDGDGESRDADEYRDAPSDE